MEEIVMLRKDSFGLSYKLIFLLLSTFLLVSCGGGNSGNPSTAGQPVIDTEGTQIRFAVKTPIQFQQAFCVSIHVSGSDFSTIVNEAVYPPTTQIIEAVVPNIPVGSDRTVEMGIFESGKCAAPVDAEWYASASGVVIFNSQVTVVDLGLMNPKVDGIGSVLIRGDRAKQEIRFHGEVIAENVTPIPDAGCRIFEGTNLVESTISGSTTTDMGVLDTDVIVESVTDQLMVQCSKPGFQTTHKVANRIVDPNEPNISTFTATVVMKRGVSISVVESNTENLIIEAKLPSLKLQVVDTPSGQFQRVSNEEQSLSLTGGGVDNFSQPEIPVLTMHVAFPIDTTDIDPQSVIVERLGEAINTEVRLYPIQAPARDVGGPDDEPSVDDDESFKFDEDIYAKGSSSVDRLISFRPMGGNSDVNIFEVKIPMVDYDATKGALTTFDALRVSVKFPGSRCFKRKRVADDMMMDDVDMMQEMESDIVAHLALNRELYAKTTCITNIKPVLNGARFLIVSAPDLLPAANNLRAHKISRGISTRVVSTDVTGTTASDIKNYLNNAYNTWFVRPKWVLFMGDAELIPTHYGNINIFQPWGENAKNAGDIYFGQFSGDDRAIPVFGMGRFPVDTLVQAQQMVDNVIAYENSPPLAALFGHSYYSRMTFAAQFQDDGKGTGNVALDGKADRGFTQTSEDIRDFLKSDFDIERVYRTKPLASSPTLYIDNTPVPAELQKPTFPWTGNATDVINAANNGTSILYHRDHGWWNGWGTPSFSTANLSSISVTGNKFPVVYSINCASGIFDNETVDLPANVVSTGYGPNPASVYWAETFVRKSDGAIGVIGDTRSSQTWVNNDMAMGLFDATWPSYKGSFGGTGSIKKLGDVLNHAKAYVKAQGWDAANERQELKIYNLLGDPTVEIKSRPPFTIEIGQYIFEKAQLIFPIIPEPCYNCPPFVYEGIVAVLQGEKGEVIGRGLVESNKLIFDVDDIGGKLSLTVSGNSIVTAKAEVEAIPGTSPR